MGMSVVAKASSPEVDSVRLVPVVSGRLYVVLSRTEGAVPLWRSGVDQRMKPIRALFVMPSLA